MVKSASFSLDRYGHEVRSRVDEALAAYAALDADCPATLAEAIRYSLLAPGKRLRPTLVVMAAEACGGSRESALPAACAIEMVHAYSLVHDDLPAMDDDDVRRGRPTCHKAFGEATAILVGDALLAMAFEVLARDVRPPEVAARCCGVLAQAAGPCALVGGQADDLAGEFSAGTMTELESIHRRKTGAMFLAAMELGALVAHATEAQHEALAAYGRRLGLLFQITDDLLDACGDSNVMGKVARKDSSRGKLTFPALLGIDQSIARARALVEEACEALERFGPQAEGLKSLAHYVLERNH
jgi:geranylgeranyl diphosphate synthase, type II